MQVHVVVHSVCRPTTLALGGTLNLVSAKLLGASLAGARSFPRVILQSISAATGTLLPTRSVVAAIAVSICVCFHISAPVFNSVFFNYRKGRWHQSHEVVGWPLVAATVGWLVEPAGLIRVGRPC